MKSEFDNTRHNLIELIISATFLAVGVNLLSSGIYDGSPAWIFSGLVLLFFILGFISYSYNNRLIKSYLLETFFESKYLIDRNGLIYSSRETGDKNIDGILNSISKKDKIPKEGISIDTLHSNESENAYLLVDLLIFGFFQRLGWNYWTGWKINKIEKYESGGYSRFINKDTKHKTFEKNDILKILENNKFGNQAEKIMPFKMPRGSEIKIEESKDQLNKTVIFDLKYFKIEAVFSAPGSTNGIGLGYYDKDFFNFILRINVIPKQKKWHLTKESLDQYTFIQDLIWNFENDFKNKEKT